MRFIPIHTVTHHGQEWTIMDLKYHRTINLVWHDGNAASLYAQHLNQSQPHILPMVI